MVESENELPLGVTSMTLGSWQTLSDEIDNVSKLAGLTFLAFLSVKTITVTMWVIWLHIVSSMNTMTVAVLIEGSTQNVNISKRVLMPLMYSKR